ncbi:hypothetical protein K2173_012099 [Erythroxylum novogranatense]|uniref:Uncharacterized protein n=1 Tax=Erythroxylum novogranatense TaxID=1862640 RepID=A0AAV8TEW2_9ROSI|nr:hypothetical protein K2173_012099 [Erythroxylum novogranatense]
MALPLVSSSSIGSFTSMPPRNQDLLLGSSNCGRFNRVQCRVVNKVSDQTITRRSGNYQPALWDYNYIQSLRGDFLVESYTQKVDKLKEDVRAMLVNKTMNRLDQLELVDTIQRLGVDYVFENEIRTILGRIYNDKKHTNASSNNDLYTEALEFRLLRQHGFKVPQEVFNIFKDSQDNFEACLCEDMKGLLSLYEATFLGEEGESILEDARDFAGKHLKQHVKYHNGDYVSTLASHALELPLHWRMPRLEARWYMDVYQTKQSTNPMLLEFAKMEYNNLQAIHQEDLKRASEWSLQTGFKEKLPFARDRISECFLWSLGIAMEPQYRYFRPECSKLNQLITTIDDIYDVYGTLDELELFTSAIERWDINMMDKLPYYMKLTFCALVNFVNEASYVALREQDVDIAYCLKKSWIDLCKAYFVEHKWYGSGYKPTLQEYLDNAWISIGANVIMVHTYFLTANPITDKAMESLKQEGYPNIIKWSSVILRLADDLETSPHEVKRGDVPKSVQCYMHETGASEEESRAHTYHLISEAWKKMNGDGARDTSFSRDFVRMCMNLGRMAQCFYQHGDGFGIVDRETKGRFLALLVQPASLP